MPNGMSAPGKTKPSPSVPINGLTYWATSAARAAAAGSTSSTASRGSRRRMPLQRLQAPDLSGSSEDRVQHVRREHARERVLLARMAATEQREAAGLGLCTVGDPGLGAQSGVGQAR